MESSEQLILADPAGLVGATISPIRGMGSGDLAGRAFAILVPDISGGGGRSASVRKVKMLLVATVMAVPTVGMFAPPASACMGEVCEAINFVCMKVTKGDPCVK